MTNRTTAALLERPATLPFLPPQEELRALVLDIVAYDGAIFCMREILAGRMSSRYSITVIKADLRRAERVRAAMKRRKNELTRRLDGAR